MCEKLKKYSLKKEEQLSILLFISIPEGINLFMLSLTFSCKNVNTITSKVMI